MAELVKGGSYAAWYLVFVQPSIISSHSPNYKDDQGNKRILKNIKGIILTLRNRSSEWTLNWNTTGINNGIFR
jgi:hypothetical protein